MSETLHDGGISKWFVLLLEKIYKVIRQYTHTHTHTVHTHTHSTHTQYTYTHTVHVTHTSHTRHTHVTHTYTKRLLKLPDASFARAALKEQVQLRLPWYSYMEPITKLDEILHLDHVSAHHILNSNRRTKNVCNTPLCNKNMNSLSGLRPANPLPSKKFRVEELKF